MGAVWKFSRNAEQTMPSLKAIPNAAWLGLSAIELLCVVGLILPAFYEPVAILIPTAATLIAVEMVLFCGVHRASGDSNNGPMNYWLTVAAVCGVIAYGRLVLEPL
jgi:hypothetical protein